MKIIDKYIFKKFITVFFSCYTSLVGIYVILDLSSKFGDFFSSGSPLVKVLMGLPAFYFINSFVLFDLFFPFLILVAAITTISVMRYNNEIIALLALGVSPGRTLVPVLIGSVLLSSFFTVVREVYMPKQLTRISQKPVDFIKHTDVFDVCRSFDNKSQISIDGEKILFSKALIIRPSILLRKNLNLYGNRLCACQGIYEESNGERPSGWLLKGVTFPSELLTKNSLFMPDLEQRIIFSPFDTPWLNDDEVFIASSLKPIHLISIENWLQYGSFNELKIAAVDPTFKNESVELAIRIHSRFWRPLTDLIPLLLGVPFVFLRSDRNLFACIVLGILLASGYIATQYLGIFLGNLLQNATIGIWIPAFLFVPFMAIMLGELLKKNLQG